MNTSPAHHRISELDGIRGLAALLVVYTHVLHRWMPHAPEPIFWLRTFSHLGWTGVHLFFVLSGFLIGGILISQRNAENYFRIFYLRRSFRILPLYAALLAACLLIRTCAPPAFAALAASDALPAWSYPLLVQNIFMAATGDFGPALLGVTWSVAVEEQFYLLLPLLVYFCAPSRLPWILLAMILLGPVFRSLIGWPAPMFLLPGVTESLAGGTLIAWAYHYKRTLFATNRALLAAAACVGVGGTAMVASVLWLRLGALRETFIALFWLGAFCLVLSSLRTRWTAWLRLRPLVWVGSISYGVYLLHAPMQHIVFLIISGKDVGDYDGSFGLLLATVSLLATITLSWLSFARFEKPLTQFAQRHRYRTKPSALSPVPAPLTHAAD